MIELDPKEKYALLAEVIHDLKKEYIKANLALTVLKQTMARESIAGRMSPQLKMINQQSEQMLKGQIQGLPNIIQQAKEERFAIYEQLKKDGIQISE